MDRQVGELKTNFNEQYLNLLCDRASPAPYYQFGSTSSYLVDSVNDLFLNTRFRDPESLSMLTAIAHGELSILKELMENKDMLMNQKKLTKEDVLRYESLKERMVVFLRILTSATNFDINQVDVNDANMFGKIQPIMIKTQLALQEYNKSVALLKKPFPKTDEDLRQLRDLQLDIQKRDFEKAKEDIYGRFVPVKPYLTVAWETGKTIGKNTGNIALELANAAKQLAPVLMWLERLGIGTEKLVMSVCLLLFLYYFGRPLGQLGQFLTNRISSSSQSEPNNVSKSTTRKTKPTRFNLPGETEKEYAKRMAAFRKRKIRLY